MNKQQKRGVVFFTLLFFITLGFQWYGWYYKGNDIDFISLFMGLALIVFCYVYAKKYDEKT